MAVQYVGARYVIKIYENKTNPSSAQWDSETEYEPLTMVTDEYNSYLSKKFVPASIGKPALNPEYWVQTGYYSGQVMELQNHVRALEQALNDEVTTRGNADAAMQSSINSMSNRISQIDTSLYAEIDNRITADNTLSARINSAVNSIESEIAARVAGDNALQTQIDNIIAPSGEAPSAAEVENARIGANGITYSTLGGAIRGQVEELDYDKADASVITLNLLDITKVLSNHRLTYTTGAVESSTGWSVSDYIPAKAGTAYVWLSASLNYTNMCAYDENKQYLGGAQYSPNEYTTPVGTKYIRASILNADLATAYIVEKNDNGYIGRGYTIDGGTQYEFKKGNIALRTEKDGVKRVSHTVNSVNGFLTDLYSLRNGTNSNTHGVMYVEEGTYNITYANLVSFSMQTYGPVLPDNFDLIGLGKGAIFSIDLTGESASAQELISTINVNKNNRIENCTFIINNGRYACHNDGGSANRDITQVFKNCKFIDLGNSEGNWNYPAGVGEGTCSNANVTYENCEFISPLRAYYLHNNVNFTKSSIHKFKNCKFICTNNRLSVQIETMGSTVRDYVTFEGCVFSDLVESRLSSFADSSIVSSDFEINAENCGDFGDISYFPNGTPTYIHTDKMVAFMNNTGNAIGASKAIKNSTNGYTEVTSDSEVETVIGVTPIAIANGEVGEIITGGYINVTGISNAVGTRIGLDENGNLAAVASGEIAIVKYVNEVYNRSFAKML